ncbi:LamG-like jellyroll fold domain-containing protein [Saccharicrinis sp. GN24d3]|uniref:LamG-like jellyroll fold domain-containing protein n=1 Tax=Saccharicrinis sp. GN24d3 TaxID=3458416 RepID=UPI0040351B25
MKQIFTFIAMWIFLSVGLHAQTKKVLIIGIDGCRPDALQIASTPNIDALVDNSTYSMDALTTPPTWSATGWSSILTGVYVEKHQVYENTFAGANFATYPDLFKFIEEANPSLQTSSMVVWDPINTQIVGHADFEQNFETDAEMTSTVSEYIMDNDVSTLFIHFDDVDHAGHAYGFNPESNPYIGAIKTTDVLVGNIVASIRNRPTYSEEDWLIILVTDHGGIGNNHGGTSLDERNIFLIASGNSIANKEITKEISHVTISSGVALNGTNEYLAATDPTPFMYGTDQDFTIECRVRTTGWSSDPAIIANKNWASGVMKGFILAAQSNGSSWKVNLGDGTHRVDVNGGTINDGKWHHLAVSCDRDGEVVLYQDGKKIGSAAMSTIGDMNSGLALAIGQDGTTSYSAHFNGSVSEVRMWNKAIDETNIIKYTAATVDNTHPDYTSLQTYWKMDESNGTAIADSKGSNPPVYYGSALTWDNTNGSLEVADYTNTPRIVDVTATALDHLGVPIPASFDGVSLLSPATPAAPTPHFIADSSSIMVGGSVNFTDLSGNAPTSWAWTFTGGTPASSNMANPTVSYADAGTYNVSLTVTNAQGNDTKTVTGMITVSEGSADPITYFPFNGNANDASGNGFDGTVAGGVTFSAENKAVFDNTGMIEIQSGTQAAQNLPTQNMTVALKVKVTTLDTWGGYIGCFQDNGSVEHGWLVGNYQNRFSFALSSQTTGTLTYLYDHDAIQLGQWYDLAATYDGTMMKLYVNGDLKVISAAQTGAINYPESGWFQIGSYKDNDEDGRHDGEMDEIKIWDRTLTDQEIADLVNSTPTAIDTDTEKSGKAVIFPNPSSSIFTVKTEDDNWSSYKVVTLSGKILETKVLESNTTIIDLSSMNKGIYLLLMQSDHSTQTHKLIVN